MIGWPAFERDTVEVNEDALLKKVLKIARRLFAIACLVLGLVSIWFWFQSYESADRLHGRLWGRQACLLASKEGRIVWLWFQAPGHDKFWLNSKHSYPTDDEMSFPVGPIRQYESGAGFGIIENPIYQVMPSTQTIADGTTVQFFGASVMTLRTTGLIVPYWFLVIVLLAIALLMIGHRVWQFGLRKMLLLFALVGVVLALSSWLDGTAEFVNDEMPF